MEVMDVLADLDQAERDLSTPAPSRAQIQEAVARIRAAREQLRSQVAGRTVELLGPKEAARLLGLGSQNTVRAWAKRGLLRAVSLPNGRIKLVKQDVLEKAAAMKALSWDDREGLTDEEREGLNQGRNGRPAPWQQR